MPDDCTEWPPAPGDVDPKGQPTIPELPRARYGFPPGTQFVWLERDSDPIYEPLLSAGQLLGRSEGSELTTMLLEEHSRDRRHENS